MSAILAQQLTERDLSQNVVNLAHMCGWKVARWPTWRPTGTDPGVPDLLLAKEGREPIFIELKAEKGRFSEDQKAWAEALGRLYYSFRPSDWFNGSIDELLR